MERQHLYERQNMVQGIGGGGVPGARVLDAPKNQNPLFDLFMRAIDTGKTAIQAGAKEYDRRQRLHIEDAVNKVNAEMDAWELEYMKTHQGADALSAQRDFADKYQELSQQAINDYGGDDYYKNLLGREFVKPAMYAIKRGTQYQYQQDELWQKSVFDGTMSNIQQGVWQNADDSDHVESLIQRGEQAIRDRFPGQDVTARINDFREKMLADQVNSLIENNRLPEAQAALDRLGGGTVQPAGGIAPGVSSGPRGHTIAEDLHNPLNLKKVGGGSGRAAFRQFADDAEGFRGAYHQLKLYYNRDGLKTPRQMISKWAPSFENNHPEYFGTIKKHGIDIDAPIDMNDPKQAARLVKAMATHEGPLGKRYSFEQIEGFLRGQTPGGTQPGTAQSESPARSSPSPRLAALQSRLDAARKRDLEQAQKTDLDSFLNQTADNPLADRMSLARERYADNRDMLSAAIRGIEADDRAQGYVRKKQEQQQEQSLYARLQAFSELPAAQGWQQSRALIERLPLDKRDKYYKAFDNLRKQGAKDDPLAIEEITARMESGEDFNILAEYGGRISQKTAQKFSGQAFRKALPEIKTMFNDVATEWLGEIANKNLAKGYGYESAAKLWTHFLNQTDADEKLDAPRLRKEAEDFFKKVVLEHGWFGRSEDTIYGLQGQAMKKYDDATPQKGTEGYEVALGYLRQKFPDQAKFSSAEIGDAYRALTGNVRKEQE